MKDAITLAALFLGSIAPMEFALAEVEYLSTASAADFALMQAGRPAANEQQAGDLASEIQLTSSNLELDSCCCSICYDSCGPCAPVSYSLEPVIPMMIGDALAVPTIAITDQGSQFFYRPVVRPATNNSAIPRDRVSLEYRMFYQAMVFEDPLAPNVGGDRVDNMDMFTTRFEKRLFSGTISLDMMVPFLVGPANENFNLEGNPTEDGELGDLTFGLKLLWWQRGNNAISTGVQVESPTGGDLFKPVGGLFNFDYAVTHDAWHFSPYLAASGELGRCFTQGFASYRMATDDEDVFDPSTGAFSHSVRSPDAMMFDLNLGYWVYDGSPCNLVKRIAPVVELSYFGTTENHQYVSSGNPALVDDGFGTVDYLTLTSGVVTQFRNNDMLTIGVAVPLREKSTFIPPFVHEGPTDRTYEWQLIVQYNHLHW